MLKESLHLFDGLSNKVNDFLDRYILPWPVRFLTFRFVILATIALLIPLLVRANNTVLVLAINSYLNTMSVAVSSIVLLYATISEARQKQIAQLQEKRAQEDHEHVTEMHRLILESLATQQRELQTIMGLVSSLEGAPALPLQAEQPAYAVDLRALHPRGEDRYEEDDMAKRWEENLYHNKLVSTIREDLKPDE
jgi:hypothetical protein